MAIDDFPTTPPPKSPRRDFLRTLGLASTTGLVTRSTHAEDDKPAPEPSEIDARMNLILARYGTHLDDDARRSIRRDVEAVIRRADRMRAFELANGDEPIPVFTPYRAPVT